MDQGGLGYQTFTGYLGTVPSGGGDWRRLEFNFTDFGGDGVEEVFAFDCDTDGTGVSGGAHAGMVITITQAGGNVLTAELLPDSADSSRAFIAW